jgi:transcription elongation GreA/GreB family factor
MHQQARETELDSHLVKGEERVVQSRERIRVAREELEKEKAGRKISEKNYQLKKEKIDNAEKAIDELDEKVRRGRRLSGDR